MDVVNFNVQLKSENEKLKKQIKSLEAKLQLDELHIGNMLNSDPVELYLKDSEGLYVVINRQFEKIFGVKNHQVVGKLPGDVHDQRLAKKTRKHDLGILNKAETIQREEKAKLITDDKTHTLRSSKYPVFDTTGNISGIGAIVHGFTDLGPDTQPVDRLDRLETSLSKNKNINLSPDRVDHISVNFLQSDTSEAPSKSILHRFDALTAILDRLHTGIVILDEKGNIATMNIAAQKNPIEAGIHQLTRGRRLKIKGLISRQGASNCKFNHQHLDLGNDPESQIIVLKKPFSQSNLLFEIMPVNELSDGTNIGTIVFIIDPEKPQKISVNGLKNLFNLTSTETDITHLLANGRSLNEISEERKTSILTVRKQVKDIFSKTSSKSQLELVRLAMDISIPFSDQ